MWYHERTPTGNRMRILTTHLDGNFSQISNELIRHPAWKKHKAAFHALMELYSYRGRHFESQQHYCSVTGQKVTALREHFKVWKRHGLVRQYGSDFEVYPFADGEQPAPVIQAEETKVIAEEISQLPRTTVRLSKEERISRIKEAWDKHRPERFALSGRIHEGIKMAIDANMKRLGIESGNYEEFIAPVLRGAAANDRIPPGAGPALVLGNKAELEDWKFEAVERMYRLGLVEKPAAPTAADSDEEILAFVNARDKNCEATRVARTQAPGLQAALDLIAHLKDERYIPLGYVNPDDLQVRNRKARVAEAGVSIEQDWLNHEVLLIVEDESGQKLAWTSTAQIPVV